MYALAAKTAEQPQQLTPSASQVHTAEARLVGGIPLGNDGQKTVDGAQDTKFAAGRIALQHGLGLKDEKGVASDKGIVKFRKLEIKPL
jgi:hypothetical protein